MSKSRSANLLNPLQKPVFAWRRTGAFVVIPRINTRTSPSCAMAFLGRSLCCSHTKYPSEVGQGPQKNKPLILRGGDKARVGTKAEYHLFSMGNSEKLPSLRLYFPSKWILLHNFGTLLFLTLAGYSFLPRGKMEKAERIKKTLQNKLFLFVCFLCVKNPNYFI